MNIYIALTPYHIMLSLLHSKRGSGDRIIVVDQVGGLVEHYTHFRDLMLSNVTWSFIKENKISRVRQFLAFGLGYVDCFLPEVGWILCQNSKEDVDVVYVFNDTPVIVQYLISNIPTDEVIYIEDGSAPYNNHYLEESRFSKLVKKIIFRDFYEFKPVLGTSKYIRSGIFSSKSLIRNENRHYPVDDYFLAQNKIEIMGEIANGLCINLKASSKCKSVLILVPYSNFQSDNKNLTEGFRNLARYCIENCWSVYLKFHPLDYNLSKNDELDGCSIIPQHAPAEIIPSLLPSLRLVVGMRTTSLASMKFIYKEKDIKIYSISESAKNGDDRLDGYFTAIGVKVCCGFSEVMSEIEL